MGALDRLTPPSHLRARLRTLRPMKTYLIKNAAVVNRGTIEHRDIFIKNGRFEQIAPRIDRAADVEIDAEGLHALPGIIDDQVHFREPGLTRKADLTTEPRAAVAGGVTSFMDMPNVQPASLTQELLAQRYERAAQVSVANYSFYMGAANDNLEHVLQTDPRTVCGVKAFMGSSTGNMLVDDPQTLDDLFRECPMLIATHCEDEPTIRANARAYHQRFGDDLPVVFHPDIRSAAGCLKSSAFAVELAKQHDTRLHILHISTNVEPMLFRNDLPLAEKRITSEVCVHHLYFNAADYARYGTQIKCNPAIKSAEHQAALLPALLDDRFDVIATDHAPHTWEEKSQPYAKAPSGVPLIQHTLNVMLEFYHAGTISLERIVEKMCHNVAICFEIEDRGYVEEGQWADLVLVDLNKEWTVTKEGLHYKCGWSPFEGHSFRGAVEQTFVSGHLAYDRGTFDASKTGERMLFDR